MALGRASTKPPALVRGAERGTLSETFMMRGWFYYAAAQNGFVLELIVAGQRGRYCGFWFAGLVIRLPCDKSYFMSRPSFWALLWFPLRYAIPLGALIDKAGRKN